MIWDGDCHFCRRWIERWREITGDAVDYVTFQEAAERFPEIPRQQFQKSVVFIDKNGEVFFAAAAVYRSLRTRPGRRWLWWSYERVPGFAKISEFAYGMVARHRTFSSTVTRLLWGEDVRPPTYLWARRWFLRALGLSYLVAFVSLWVQVEGLIGSNGILPISQFLPAAEEQLGYGALSVLPTLCWLNSSDAFLHFLCGGGVVLSLLLIFGIAPVISLVALFVFYLSLVVAGQAFLRFQWDILLLEAGFLAIFFAPWQLWPGKFLSWPASATATIATEKPVSRAAVFLLKLLLFKLMVMSGVVKLTSYQLLDNPAEDTWWNLTALNYHYWSQPLPTIFAWWADQHPIWFKKFSVAFCLVVEIIVPLFIWAPRRPRLIAAGLLILLQIAIAVTGNYCFFNLLAVALCLLLFDDAAVGAARPPLDGLTVRRPTSAWGLPRVSKYAAIVVIIFTLPLNTWLIFTAFKPKAEWPRPLVLIYGRIGPFHILNDYGLFRVMTKDRREIVVEGSADMIDWLPYEFKWKPGDVKRAPGWCAPHQPRLDWQMWFAALGSPREKPWFDRFVLCLLENKPEVIELLQHNPFPDAPPRYIRAIFYRYRFTTADEHRQTGVWWKRQELGEYLRPVSLP